MQQQRPAGRTPPAQAPQAQPTQPPATTPPPAAQTPAQRPTIQTQPQAPAAAPVPPPPATTQRPVSPESPPPAAGQITPQQPAQQPPAAQTAPQTTPQQTVAQPRRIEDVRQQRREERRGDQTIIVEGDRTIIRDGNRAIIRRNEADRFRYNARDVRVDRRGDETRTVAIRADGTQIVTITDDNGRLIRRLRRDPRGREVIIIDNSFRPGPRYGGGYRDYYVDLPPPVIRIPRERYIVEADRADEELMYETLIAPPVEQIDRRYTLDEVRYSPQVRDRMPRIDIDTVNFDTGSWEVTPDQVERLAPIAEAIKRAIAHNPNEVYLIEGHTDRVGADDDNLSLSDRRAESVARLLSDAFQIPPENLTTQGYGEQYPKVQTEGPERRNRRVAVRRITPLIAGQAQAN
jgi:outer membrane protein OmpA-like peptidoglycan-associated protein